MAKTAAQLRAEIEEYLTLRIRSKPAADRTHREEQMLEKLENLSEDLIDQENAKLRQQDSALESLSEKMLLDVLRSSTALKRLRRTIPEEGE